MTTSTTHSSPFDNLVIFSPVLNGTTGAVKQTKADLGPDAKVPPSTIASMGTFLTIDPATLRIFENIRSSQKRVILESGTRTMGLYCVPAEKAPLVAEKLDEIKAEFYVHKEAFLAEFDEKRARWLAQPEYREWAPALSKRLAQAGSLEKKLQCDWYGFSIPGAKVDLPLVTSTALNKGLERAKEGLGNQILEEVAQMAATTFRDSLHEDDGRPVSQVTRRIFGPLNRILGKLSALSFTDPRLEMVIRYVKGQLSTLSDKGNLTSKDLGTIYQLYKALSEPDDVLDLARFLSASSMKMDDENAADVQAMIQMPVQPELVLSAPVEDDLSDSTPTPASAEVEDDSNPVTGQEVYDDL